jgi:hypothetical protein
LLSTSTSFAPVPMRRYSGMRYVRATTTMAITGPTGPPKSSGAVWRKIRTTNQSVSA